MSRFIELLDELKKRRQIEADNAAAELLGLHRARLHEYREGKARPDAYACTRLAVEMGIDPMGLIAQVEAESAKNEERRRFWRDFFRRVKRPAAMLALIFIAFWCSVPDSYATALQKGAKSLTENGIIRNVGVRYRQQLPVTVSAKPDCPSPPYVKEKR